MKKILFKILGIIFLLLSLISAIIFIKVGIALCMAAVAFEMNMVLCDILGLFIIMVCSLAFGMFGFVIFNENK